MQVQCSIRSKIRNPANLVVAFTTHARPNLPNSPRLTLPHPSNPPLRPVQSLRNSIRPKGTTGMSPARQSANAANAQLSTGPRTEEGKARSSQNARSHGLTASHLVISDHDPSEL